MDDSKWKIAKRKSSLSIVNEHRSTIGIGTAEEVDCLAFKRKLERKFNSHKN